MEISKHKKFKRVIRNKTTKFKIVIMEENKLYMKRYSSQALIQTIKKEKIIICKQDYYDSVLSNYSDDELFDQFKEYFIISKSMRIAGLFFVFVFFLFLFAQSLVLEKLGVLFQIVSFIIMLLVVVLFFLFMKTSDNKQKIKEKEERINNMTQNDYINKRNKLDKIILVAKNDKVLNRNVKKILVKSYNNELKIINKKIK